MYLNNGRRGGRRRFQNNNNGRQLIFLAVCWLEIFCCGLIIILTKDVNGFAPSPGVDGTTNGNRKRNLFPLNRGKSKMIPLSSSSLLKTPSSDEINNNNDDDNQTAISSSSSSASTASTTSSTNNLTASSGIFCFFGMANPKPTMAINIVLLAFLIWKRNIPQSDILFAFIYSLYLCCVNRYRFDRNQLGLHKEQIPLLREGRGPWFKKYVTFYGFIGLLFPLALCLLFAIGGESGVEIANAAAPHLFLTICQVTMETLSKSPYFHAIPSLLIPIGYNTFRIRTLWLWTKRSYEYYFDVVLFSKTGGSLWKDVFPAFAFGLAVVNLVGWIYNLFIFLLLRTVPQYLNRDEFPDPNINWKGAIIPVLADKK